MHNQRRKGRYLLSISLVCGLAIAGLCSLTIAPSRAFAQASANCNVLSYGATGNGSTKDTAAIQAAINACAGDSKRAVVFPAGNYLSAPLFLSSDLTLDIEAGATLLASQTTSDYTIPPGVTVATPILAFLNADGASDLTITGGGVINGQGAPWWASGASTSQRPRLIEIANGSNITIKDITLENSPSMHLYLKGTDHVLIDDVTISAPANSPNTDGIDPATSHDVTIEDSTISDGDDNIAIKSEDVEAAYPNEGSSDITIENCIFGTGHGVSIGNDLQGGVKGVVVKDSVFVGTTNGIRIKATRTTGGEVADITYKDLVMSNVANPIWFSGYYPDIPASDTAQPVTATTPNYHDITVENLVISGGSNIGTIVGLPEEAFSQITLKHIIASATTGLLVRNATITVKESAFAVVSGPVYILETDGTVNS
jgi:polygalacturonase